MRLELRDFAYSGYVSSVNGCNYADVVKIEADPAHAAQLTASCDKAAFGSDPKVASLNAAGAKDLLKTPSAEVINNIVFQGGISWLFSREERIEYAI